MLDRLVLALLLTCLFLVAGAPVAAQPASAEGKRDIELPSQWSRPEISASAVPDPRIGINVHLKVRHFDFDSNTIGTPFDVLEGRRQAFGFVHLYINGRKKNRLYGPDFYLKEDELTQPENQVEFMLGTPGYGNWLVNGRPVSRVIKIKKPERPNQTRPSRKPKK
ncbi:MAG: hypothetical protein AB7S38_12570 [Vulcanimicrobiota bacterium]